MEGCDLARAERTPVAVVLGTERQKPRGFHLGAVANYGCGGAIPGLDKTLAEVAVVVKLAA